MRTENCEYLGTFWLPDRPDRKVHGTLTIEDGGRVTLKTVGLLVDRLDLMNQRVTEHPRIVGALENGEPVTLEEADYPSHLGAFCTPPSASLRVRTALIGVALDVHTVTCFHSITFTTDCIDEWHQKTGISVDLDSNTRASSIRFVPLADVELWSAAGQRLQLAFEWSLSGLGATTQASVTQRSFLRYSTNEAVTIGALTRVVHRIQHFLSFAVGTTVSLSDVSVGLSGSVADSSRGASERTVRVHYRSYPFREKQPRVDNFKMLVPYAVLEGSMQVAMDGWFSVYDRTEKALGLYWGALNDAARYLDGRFLFIAQALEAYHRLSSLAAGAPVIEKVSLARRLEHLARPFAVYFDDPRLVRKVVDTRNYFTHWDPRLKEKSATVEELWPICAKLEALFCLLLMREIGLTSDTIGQLVEKNRELKWRLGYRCGEKSAHAS